MNIDEAFPSKWLKAADFQGKRIQVTLSKVIYEEMQDGSQKPALYFQGKEKGVILNKTNAAILKAAYGSDTDKWDGEQAILSTHKVRNPDGKLVDGFTFSFPESVVLDDEIPF